MPTVAKEDGQSVVEYMLAVNRHSLIQVRRQSWAVAIAFLVAFCWLGWAAVKFGSIFQGMGVEHSLALVNRFALRCGPLAFPLFGVLAAGTFIFSDLAFRKRWIDCTLFLVFLLLAIFAFRGLLVSGVFMVPNAGANIPAAGKAGTALLFAIVHHRPGLPEPGR
jgi:hypothetical protein